MSKYNTIGVDLAKNVVQISIVSAPNKQLINKSLSRTRFAKFLAKQNPSLVAYEACATAHYWARVTKRHGHNIKIIPAKAITAFRQGHEPIFIK